MYPSLKFLSILFFWRGVKEGERQKESQVVVSSFKNGLTLISFVSCF